MAALIQVSESIDTSRYECIDSHLQERPLPNKLHSEIQLAVVNLLRAPAK